jgi:addiction module RelE/StbE family toxin
MKIHWTEPAIIDLENIRDYIAKDTPNYALEFVNKIMNTVEKLSEFPIIGRKVPEVSGELIREILFNNYRIIYQITSVDDLLILAIVHASRDIKNVHPHPWDIH